MCGTRSGKGSKRSMIDADVRNAIYQLHLAGTPLHDISRQFRVSRNSVRRIIREQGAMPHAVRKDKIQIDPELLRRLYDDCEGWIQRMHEKLVEEEKIQVSYPTLTRLVRALGLGRTSSARCDHVPDKPGAEMQHDTTVYRVKLAEQTVRLVASVLYLRYSKRRYLKFYRAFNRFAMKCFLHEALLHWEYAAPLCIIDNTSLARLRGSGKRAVRVWTSFRTRTMTASSATWRTTSAIHPAIRCISASPMPRVVTAGVPTRMPDVTNGLFVLNGIAFLLTVIAARSSAVAASLPVTPAAVRSTSIRWLSVPPDTIRRPSAASAAASVCALACSCRW